MADEAAMDRVPPGGPATISTAKSPEFIEIIMQILMNWTKSIHKGEECDFPGDNFEKKSRKLISIRRGIESPLDAARRPFKLWKNQTKFRPTISAIPFGRQDICKLESGTNSSKDSPANGTLQFVDEWPLVHREQKNVRPNVLFMNKIQQIHKFAAWHM